MGGGGGYGLKKARILKKSQLNKIYKVRNYSLIN